MDPVDPVESVDGLDDATDATDRPLVRVAAIDDHAVVREGIELSLARRAPDLRLVASVDDVETFLTLGVTADVLLLDLGLADGSSAPSIPRLTATGAKVLVYTTQEKPVPLRAAVAYGACGVLLKSDPPETLVAAVRGAARGEFCCSGPLAHALLNDPGLVAELSPRQVEILRALDEGLTYRQVAASYGAAKDAASVKTHLARIREKFRALGLEPGNTHHLAWLAQQQGHLD